MKKITFIYPAIGKKAGKKYIRTWKMEPLPIATLAGLTPPAFQKEFFDDRIELIDYDTNTNLVAITVETYTAKRAYSIAKRFRDRDIPVVMGGYHPSHLSEEALQFCDSVVAGNAEHIWSTVLSDFENGKLKPLYKGTAGYNSGMPDHSIYQGKRYLNLGLVETGRGCQFDCSFCHITTYYEGKYYPRAIPDIINEIKISKKKYFFFVDDNLVSNRQFALELFKELARLNIFWASQGALTVAKDEELLHWMKKSGCILLLIGFESLEAENLKQMNKSWNLRIGDLQKLVQTVHKAGIGIYATFVFGFDFDTPETFRKTVEFAVENKFIYAAFNHLLPFPGTRLYDRLKKENRLLKPKWWLDDSYKYGDVVFKPAAMSPEELSRRCVDARNEFFKLSSIFSRGVSLFGRNTSLALMSIFLSSNLHLKEEVGGKLSLPLGANLDELPK